MPETTILLVSQAKGTNLKKTILEDYKNTPHLKEVIELALNPYKVYNTKRLPEVELDTQFTLTWGQIIAGIEEIYHKELRGDKLKEHVSNLLKFSGSEQRMDIIKRILLKDLRCGVGVSTVNKVWKGLIPEFSVALAETYEQKRLRLPAFIEIKWDGKRVISFVSANKVKMYSRNGIEIDGYNHIRRDILSQIPPGMVLDGELMEPMFGDRKSQEGSVIYRLFDCMTDGEWKDRNCPRPLWERKADLGAMVGAYQGDDLLTFSGLLKASERGYGCLKYNAVMIVESEYELMSIFNEAVSLGHEGIMVKNLESLYEWDRGWEWLKLKPIKDVDLEITGFYKGEAGKQFENCLGGFTVDFNGVPVDVGGGYSVDQRVDFWNRRMELIGKTIEVRYTEITPDGSLRFPRFVRLREDK